MEFMSQTNCLIPNYGQKLDNSLEDNKRDHSLDKRIRHMKRMTKIIKSRLNSLSVIVFKKTIKFIDNFVIISDETNDKIKTYLKLTLKKRTTLTPLMDRSLKYVSTSTSVTNIESMSALSPVSENTSKVKPSLTSTTTGNRGNGLKTIEVTTNAKPISLKQSIPKKRDFNSNANTDSTLNPNTVSELNSSTNLMDGCSPKPKKKSKILNKNPKNPEIRAKLIHEVFINQLLETSNTYDSNGTELTQLKVIIKPNPKPEPIRQMNKLFLSSQIMDKLAPNEKKTKKNENHFNKRKTFKIKFDFIEKFSSLNDKSIIPFIELSAENLYLLRRFLKPNLPFISTQIIKDIKLFEEYFAEKTQKNKDLNQEINEMKIRINELKEQLADTPKRHQQIIFETKMKKWCPNCLHEVITNQFIYPKKSEGKGVEYFCGQYCKNKYLNSNNGFKDVPKDVKKAQQKDQTLVNHRFIIEE